MDLWTVLLGVAAGIYLIVAPIKFYWESKLETRRRNRMALSLAVTRKKELPFFLEYLDGTVSGTYRVDVITPAWSEELQTTSNQTADELADKFVELASSWDITDEAAPILDGGNTALAPRANRGELFMDDVVLGGNGKAYRVVEVEPVEEEVEKRRVVRAYGKLRADDLTAEGKNWPMEYQQRVKFGGVTLELAGDAEAEWVVPLDRAHVVRVPAPILSACINSIMSTANTGVDEQKKG